MPRVFGLARYSQGAIEDAKRAMAIALRAQPGHAAAASNLAALLRLTGSYEAPEKLLREALARNPHDAGARLNLVGDALQEERAADALALLNAVDPPADDLAAARHWHLHRALALIALNRPDKGCTALGEFDALGPAPPELKPLRLWRDTLLALAEGRRAEARAAAEEMEAALDNMGPGAVLEHRIMTRYDLAKFWSREGDNGKAFAQWQAGHAQLKTLQPFSREATRIYGAQVKQPVNARGLGRWKAYATDLAPLIDELDRAGALEGWRERAAMTASLSLDPVPSSERPPE